MKFAAALFALAVIAADAASQSTNPFAFLDPLVVVSERDRETLDGGDTVARTLPAKRDVIGIFAAVRVSVTTDGFEAWMHLIEEFKKNGQILQIGRFSEPPRLEDLQALTFPDTDVEDVSRCRVGDCALKLTAPEIADLQRLTDRSPTTIQDQLRSVMFQRLLTYRENGHGALGAYADRSAQPIPLAATFCTLLDQLIFLRKQVPAFSDYIEQWPHGDPTGANEPQNYFYWSKEQYGGRPIVSVTHVFILRGSGNGTPDVLVVGKQLFATHYIDGWLGVTALVRDAGTGGAYVVYAHRSSVDLLRGFWGGLIRRVLQRRLAAEAPGILLGIRRRLEGKPPLTGDGSVAAVLRPFDSIHASRHR